ncbi:MAG: MFS transporter [Gemmobacter sp.]|jgi:predicted MFS family arabinose efflux permease|nr:MFS transporter [Gemmobacter sp.]
MRFGIACLIGSYLLSQFYRAFLAVLVPVLKADLGATPEDLAAASGLWFLAFAATQIPVGIALDRIGPRWTATVALSVGGGLGAAIFATATTPLHIQIAMALIGIGCAPVLMASYYIFARSFPPAVFGTLAGMSVGVGNIGNIGASLPLAWAVEAFGWRNTLWALTGLTLVVAGLIAVAVRDPARVPPQPGGGSLRTILTSRGVWPVYAMMTVAYMPAAAMRGLWIGPYYADVFAADTARIGQVTLVMGLAMVAGNFAYGPLDRVFHSRKWVILTGNLLCALCFFGLWAMPAASSRTSLALIALIGLFGCTYPMIMAHCRAFLPPHLIGRGVTLLNLASIGSAGLAQVVTGRIHAAIPPDPPSAPYAALFLGFGLAMLAGCALYLLSEDRTD